MANAISLKHKMLDANENEIESEEETQGEREFNNFSRVRNLFSPSSLFIPLAVGEGTSNEFIERTICK